MCVQLVRRSVERQIMYRLKLCTGGRGRRHTQWTLVNPAPQARGPGRHRDPTPMPPLPSSDSSPSAASAAASSAATVPAPLLPHSPPLP